jgi:hypothetical protein
MHIINACVCKYACFFDTLYHYALTAKVETQDFASHKGIVQFSGVIICTINSAILARETQNLALLSQQFFNIASKGLFFGVVLTDCYISNKYGQSVQSFFCAPITELCRVMSSFSAACSVSDTLTRFAKS